MATAASLPPAHAAGVLALVSNGFRIAGRVCLVIGASVLVAACERAFASRGETSSTVTGARRHPSPPTAPTPPVLVRVIAAGDLALAFTELEPLFERATGHELNVAFASSGRAARQLRQGAPFDVFASASISFVNEVVQAGACDGTTVTPLARGRLVVWAKRGALEPPRSLTDLRDPRFRRIAIANPEHAPFGVAAREALEHAGVWQTIGPRLVYGENVQQTLQFAQSGNVEVALVAISLVVQDRENPWFLVDEVAHRPIDQALVVCTHGAARPASEVFVRYVRSKEGRSVLQSHGLVLPGEPPRPVP